ncbi:MAG: hypothetical protein ACYC42_00640 [Lysobacter sp.]
MAAGGLIARDLLNATVFKAMRLNYTCNPLRRLQIEFGIGHHEGLIQVQCMGTQTLRATPAIVADPEPQALIASDGDSSVIMHF